MVRRNPREEEKGADLDGVPRTTGGGREAPWTFLSRRAGEHDGRQHHRRWLQVAGAARAQASPIRWAAKKAAKSVQIEVQIGVGMAANPLRPSWVWERRLVCSIRGLGEVG